MLHETCAFARIIQVHAYKALTSRLMKKQLLIVLCVSSHSLPAAAHLRLDVRMADPVYLAEPYTGQDIVLLSETPFEEHPCEELTFDFSEEGASAP
jgi:hypothetical protein